MSDKEYSIIPNPNFIFRKKVEEEIKNNGGYCISCSEKNEDTKCICSEFKNQQHSGWCKCGQYYKILKASKIYLCGDIEFKSEIKKIANQLTLEGHIVLTPTIQLNYKDLNKEEKELLNEIYKTEIDECDLVYVINQNGYIDNLTREQINWAIQLGKKIEYLEQN